MAVDGPADSGSSIERYNVNYIDDGQLEITGAGSDTRWSQVPMLTAFHYPWENDVPLGISFRALHDSLWLYCLFQVKSANVKLYQVQNEKAEILQSDRVEIFFRKDRSMSPYYCLEIDPLARVYDYEANYHRVFNPSWSWPEGHLRVLSNQHRDGYDVEIAISKSSLERLGLLTENQIAAGIYRAECIDINEGIATMKWISWISPTATSPDFHIPSSFGRLALSGQHI
jgi:hypothetical protein